MKLKQLTKEYNRLVLYADGIGIPGRLHRSDFESIAKGKIQLNKLRQKVIEKWWAQGFVMTSAPIPQRAAQ